MSHAPPAESPWAPLRIRAFRWLWLASVASNVGTWMHDVAAGWLMTTLTASPFLIGLVQTATLLPGVVAGLPAGVLADRIDRRRLLLGLQGWAMCVAAALGFLTLRGETTPALLLLLTFLLGLGASLSFPAWYAAMPEMVPREQIPAVVALNGAAFNVARAVGPVLAGVVMARAGPGAVFLLNAVSFVGVLATIWLWRRPPLPVAPRSSFLRQALEGFRATFGHRVVRGVLVQVSVFGLSAAALWALLPAVGRYELRLSGATYGVLLGCMGAGAVAGVVVLPRLRGWVGVERVPMLAAVGFSAALFTLGTTRALLPVGVALVVAGVAWMVIGTTYISTVQLATSGALQGRVISIYLLVALGGMTLGSVLWGGVASLLGTRVALLVAAGGVLGVVPAAVVWGRGGIQVGPRIG